MNLSTASLPTPVPDRLSATQRHIKKIQSDRRAAEAWEYLDAKVRGIVHGSPLVRSLPVDADADDLAQAVLVRVLLSITEFKVEPRASFAGWVHLILGQKVNSLWRRANTRGRDRRRTVYLDDLDGFDPTDRGGDDPSLLSHADDVQARAVRAVAELDARDRRVLNLREEHGMSFREIGNALGAVPETTARSIFHRARARRMRVLRSGFGVPRKGCAS